MIKPYIKPETKTIKVELQHIMQGGSDVKTGGTTKDVYSSTDVTYSKGFSFEPDEIETEE